MKLFTPITFRNIELKNRIVMSPMCMYSAEDGVANDFHFVHYGSRAQGGAGLIIVEATGVEPRGRITNKCLGIWNNEQALALKKSLILFTRILKVKSEFSWHTQEEKVLSLLKPTDK